MSDGVSSTDLPVTNPREGELRLWASYGRGLLVDLRAGDPEVDALTNKDRWDESRRVRPEVVAALMLGAVDPVVGCVPGVRLAGAVVEGAVDVREGMLRSGVSLTDCYFTGGLLLNEAHTHTIDLSGSTLLTLDLTAAEIGGSLILDRCVAADVSFKLAHISGNVSLNRASLFKLDDRALNASGMIVNGDMLCRGGFRAEGAVWLIGSHIGGQLSLDDAHLCNPGDYALVADGMTVNGGIFCTGRFRVEGGIRLPRAHVGEQLSLGGAYLSNPGHNALSAAGVSIEGNAFCDDGFTAEGEVNFTGAHVTGTLSLSGAQLSNPGRAALRADYQMTVDGGIFCDEGFKAEGEVDFTGARVTGTFSLSSAKLDNPGGNALTADRMIVDGRMDCTSGFQAQGTVRLRSVHITEWLNFRSAVLCKPDGLALDCNGVEAGSLWLESLTVAGETDLSFARVTVLHDNPSSGWPAPITLDGFVYDDLQPYAEARGSSGRLSWLGYEKADYRAQPYEQLAAYYRRLGHDEEARNVLIAKQRHRRAKLGIFGKSVGYALDWMVGYGYKPAKAFAWLVALIVLGSVYFTINHAVPLNLHHPHYQPVLYAADLVIPIVNLGQASAWAPPAGVAQWIAAGLTALGWVFATAAVAGITRVLTRA